MVNLNEMCRGIRWHVIDKTKRDWLFCEKDALFVPINIHGLPLPNVMSKQQFEHQGFVFITKIPQIPFDEYLEDYHNQELAKFKTFSLDEMCEELRRLYIECEENIKCFNKEKNYSKFREILNNSIGLRHGKSNQNPRPANIKECIEAFEEYQKFGMAWNYNARFKTKVSELEKMLLALPNVE